MEADTVNRISDGLKCYKNRTKSTGEMVILHE